MPLSASTDAATSGCDNENARQEQIEVVDPIAVLLAGGTRTTIFALKRIGLSPEGLQTFLWGKGFMRTAVITTTAATASASASASRISSSSGRLNTSFVAEIIKNSVMGLSVFGVYELALARVGREPCCRRAVSYDMTPSSLVEREDVGTVVGYLREPATQHGEPETHWGHASAGAQAGFAQSVLMDAFYWWKHRRQSNSMRSVNLGLVARRAARESAGFAALFGTYEAARQGVEDGLYHHIVRRSTFPLEQLERYRVVSRDEHSGAYDAPALSMGAAFVAGGVAGQVHMVVNHYTHSLFALHHSGSRRRNGATNLPKPPTARAIAGAFVPSALCFLAFCYGGTLAERMLEDGTDTHPPKMLPIYRRGDERFGEQWDNNRLM